MASSRPMGLLFGPTGILLYNDALQDLLGASYTDALGGKAADWFPETTPILLAGMEAALQHRPTQVKDLFTRLKCPEGERAYWFDLDFTPVADGEGRVHATLVGLFDTTAHNQAMRELNLQRERVDLALDSGGLVGLWEIDFINNTIRSDARFARLHGIEPALAEGGVPRTIFQNRVHPEDLQRVIEATQRAQVSGYYRSQHRVVGDGEVRWIHASGRTQFDEEGAARSFAGIAVDITPHVMEAELLAESERRFRSLTESMPQAVFSVDADGNANYLNGRWYDYTGISREQGVQHWWHGVVHRDDVQQASDAWAQSVGQRDIDLFDQELRILHNSGVYRWCRVIAQPVRASDGAVSGWVGTITDIHEARLLQVERELVSRELDHRIKNFFAVANGLVSLTASDTADVGLFRERLTQRLRALHHAYGFIGNPAQGDGQQCHSLQDLIRQLLEPFAAFDRITLSGPDVRIGKGVVTSLALVFHELATNAAKYGALASPEGRLSLQLEQDRDGVTLDWVEQFDQAAPAVPGGGFGSRMLSLVVEAQLGGHLHRELSDGRLLVRIELPMARLQV